MLTNIYYYNHYKPYILKTEEAGASAPVKRSKIAAKPDSGRAQSFLLNKAMKADVVNYAHDVSKSVTGLKDSARFVLRDMEDFNKNAKQRGYATAKQWIAEDMTEFVKSYNESTAFMDGQTHSQNLREYSDDVKEYILFNKDRLAALGVGFTEDNKMVFDKGAFNKLEQEETYSAIGESMQIFGDVYNRSTQQLSIPLSEHMNFKSLNYYYNYKLGAVVNDTFKIIESGMIVDRTDRKSVV